MKLLSAALACVFSIAVIAPATARAGTVRFGSGDRGDWFDKADANRDGRVTRAEFMAFRLARFGQLDRNHDGVVSPADFRRLASFRPKQFARVTEALDNADTNGDGAISRAELANTEPRMFDLADADRDGEVTRAEFDASRQRTRDLAERRR